MQRLSQIVELIESTSDAAFVSEVYGTIVAWNKPAEILLEKSKAEAIGKKCWDIIRGVDECGPLCCEECIVRQAAGKNRPTANFDVQLTGISGKPWCNFYILYARGERSGTLYIIHLLRNVDLRKRLELVVRDFIVQSSHLSLGDTQALLSVSRTPARAIHLTSREQQIVGLLASGLTAREVAAELHISYATANNHIQHLMKKFAVKTRLEAIRRAERAGLI
jgi:DNA-binding CsgD family transcriptional regulator